MIILRYHEVFFRLSAPRCSGTAAGAVSLKNPHHIITLRFSEVVKDDANEVCLWGCSAPVLWSFGALWRMLYFMHYCFCSSHGYGCHAILHHISDHRAKSNCLRVREILLCTLIIFLSRHSLDRSRNTSTWISRKEFLIAIKCEMY